MTGVAYLFAGQGAQYVGMGQELAQAYPDQFLSIQPDIDALGINLIQTCFDGPLEKLTQTSFAQPGIFWVSWLAKLALESRLPNLQAASVAGLSLGEFTALTAAGVFDFKMGLQVVHQRGLAMQDACESSRGTMAAVIGLDRNVLDDLCQKNGATMANINCPGQIVISGPVDAIQITCQQALAAGARKALPLEVAGAYHSPLMQPAALVLADVLNHSTMSQPSLTTFSNVTAQPHTSIESIRSLLVRQVCAPVLWEDGIRNMIDAGISTFIELGPGKALTGFMKRIDKTVTVVNVENVESLDAAVDFLGKIS